MLQDVQWWLIQRNEFVRVHKLQGLVLVASFVAYGQFGMSRITSPSDRKKFSWRRCSLIFRVTMYHSVITRFLAFPAEPFWDPFWHQSTDVAHTWAPKSQDKVDMLFLIRKLQKWAKILADLINLVAWCGLAQVLPSTFVYWFSFTE